MEPIANKFSEDNEYLYQKIPNSISSKELYAEKDLGVYLFFNLISLFI